MASAGQRIRDLTALYRVSPSYRRVVIIITALTVAPLLIGLVEGARVGGSVLGYAIWFFASVGLTGIWLRLSPVGNRHDLVPANNSLEGVEARSLPHHFRMDA
jgi:hypothetical protein